MCTYQQSMAHIDRLSMAQELLMEVPNALIPCSLLEKK